MVLDDCFKSAGPGRVSLPYLPGGLRKTTDPSCANRRTAFFFDFFRMQKNAEKTERQKTTFFAIFSDFGSPRRRFLAIFGPKTGPRRLLFRCFLENGDFVKIVLLLVVGTRFCRAGPFKNRSGERLRTAPARKNDKNRFRRRLRTHFFGPGLVFCGFWGPELGPKIVRKLGPRSMTRRFLVVENRFLAFSSLGRVPEGSRTASGASGDTPGSDFRRISGYFSNRSAGILRALPGAAGVLPGSTPNLSNPFNGVPLGYGDSRSGLNNIENTSN